MFEGWVRPLGVTGASGQLFSCKNPNFDGSTNIGICEVWLDQQGSLTAFYDLGVHPASLGLSGKDIVELGGAAVAPSTGSYASFTMATGNRHVAWGQWNHIGFAMEQKVMGDTFSALDQPLILGEQQQTHGARCNRVYMTLNGKIVGWADATVNNFENRHNPGVGYAHGVLPYGSDDVATYA